jgi:SPX domain protein involved in polyphosphate accumulation
LPWLQLYHERIEKSEKAMALRLRWYGTSPNFIFFERKTHHEDWTGEKSVKERFGVKEKYVNRFLAGEWKLDEQVAKMQAKGKSQKEIDYQLNLAKEIQESVLARKLQPAVRTFYNRTAFQHPTSQEVRISLDTELTMVREMDRTNGNWYRKEVGVDYPFPTVPDNEITRFPYAILEVKLQTAAGDKVRACHYVFSWLGGRRAIDLMMCMALFQK